MDDHGVIHSRGYLPHRELGSKTQFVTWRLADSVPGDLIDWWKKEIERLHPSESARVRELYRRIETYLDQGHGSCILRNPVAAIIVQNALVFHHASLYELFEWVVMPNHVHELLRPKEGVTLSKAVHANKSFTANEIRKHLGGEGRLWQPEYYDRFIRDEEHFQNVARYIRRNPVKAKLCADPTHWAYNSANPLALEKLGRKPQ